jgi:hypothetical protein
MSEPSEPILDTRAFEESRHAPRATVDTYASELTLEVGQGVEPVMWMRWHYAVGGEGNGTIERRSWDGLDIRRIFNELADEWRRETALESFVVRKVMHFSYQSIIGLGPAVVPLLLEALAREPQDWFWALAAIAREDVAEGADNFEDAAAAWLAWGKGLHRGLPVASSA